VVGAFNGIGDAMKAAGKDAAAYDAAMKKLTPSGRALVEQLQRMKPLLQGLRDEAQTAFLPGVTAMLRDSEGLFPIFRENIRKTGEIMGDSARKMGELFKSDAFKANLKGLLDASAPIVRAIGDGLVGLTGSLVKFGAKMAPVALGVADFINGVVAGFKGLLDRLAPHAESFKRIFSALGKVFEVLLPAIGDVAGQIADWLAPAIEKLARWMSEHQDQLGGWIKALGIFFLTLKGLKIVGEVTTWTKSVVGLLDTVGKSAFINEGKVGKLAKSLGGVARFLGGAALVGGLALGGDALIPEKVGEKGSSGQHFRCVPRRLPREPVHALLPGHPPRVLAWAVGSRRHHRPPHLRVPRLRHRPRVRDVQRHPGLVPAHPRRRHRLVPGRPQRGRRLGFEPGPQHRRWGAERVAWHLRCVRPAPPRRGRVVHRCPQHRGRPGDGDGPRAARRCPQRMAWHLRLVLPAPG
jgi:hypothetical protein